MQRIPHFFLSKRQSVDFIMQGLRTKVLREAETPDYLVFRCTRFPAAGQGAGVFEGLKR